MLHGRGREELKENILGISSKGVAGSRGGWKKPRGGSVAGFPDCMVIGIPRVLGVAIWGCSSGRIGSACVDVLKMIGGYLRRLGRTMNAKRRRFYVGRLRDVVMVVVIVSCAAPHSCMSEPD
jgi:hypothetical protein